VSDYKNQSLRERVPLEDLLEYEAYRNFFKT